MSLDPRHAILFEPIEVGPKTLPNRFYQVPYSNGFGTERFGSQARLRSVRAEGGWGAVCTEFCAVSPESDQTPVTCARLWDDDDAAALAVMCDEVHAHGALAGIELHHAGVHAARGESRGPAMGPSQLAGDVLNIVPKAMEIDDIRRVQRQWVQAAERACNAGFDIVYVYGAHSFLPLQFLAPYYNRRTDRYGGSLENRARFWLETLEAVRLAVGDRCCIAARIAVDALGGAGIDVDDGIGFIRLADALVDLWDVNLGSFGETGKDAAPSRSFGSGHQLEWTRRVRAVTAKPIVGVGRFVHPDQMAEAIAAGGIDIIGAARPAIADPFLPSKIAEGRLRDIRTCIGSNECLASLAGRQLRCSQNATAGEEFRRAWHPERFARSRVADAHVLVVGAGPAGMECARVLGHRGHRWVRLVDAADAPGGHIRWLSRLPGLHEWQRVVSYRSAQLDQLPNVELVLGEAVTNENVLRLEPDIVVVATGARWAADGLNGFTRAPIPGADASLPHVLTPEQLLADGKPVPGDRVLVYDCEGYLVGAGVAQWLAGQGHRVTLATPLTEIAPQCDKTREGASLRRQLHDSGVAFARRTRVLDLDAGRVIVADEFDDQSILDADAVVLVTQRVSNDALYRASRSASPAVVYRVGDCVTPQNLADVTFEGHRLAREIDSRNPAVPLPYLRERALPVINPVGG